MKFDIKEVPVWVAPDEDGAKILTMPNVPQPLHGVNPRTILGRSTWDHMRKKCYYDARYKCQACGRDLKGEICHAHELYTINYVTGESVFKRAVCLCPMCHVLGIHSGRALTLLKKNNPLMTNEKVLAGAENLFKQLYEYNEAHPDEEPLRAYATFIDYYNWEPLKEDMKALIKKYKVKFYRENKEQVAEWSKWHLRMGKKTVFTPYKDQSEWEWAMEVNNASNQNAIKQPPKGEAELEVEKILAEALEKEDIAKRDA